MIKKIDVYASKIKVGTLALTNDNRVAFSINPFKLPLSTHFFHPEICQSLEAQSTLRGFTIILCSD